MVVDGRDDGLPDLWRQVRGRRMVALHHGQRSDTGKGLRARVRLATGGTRHGKDGIYNCGLGCYFRAAMR